ncbi:MAG: 50S ribosome-binding GTPase [Actinomycetota bacterium]|nr:50S ribosome-binding GTPase [Actinomycetota bacterium]
MSPLLMGRRRVVAPDSQTVAGQARALRAAIEAGGDQLDRGEVVRAGLTIEKVEQRSALAGDHTVVALAGATGSGKSSIFNAVAGAGVAEIGARRPTTSTPTAAVWGESSAGRLLDWLGVSRRHAVSSVASLAVDGADDADGSPGVEGSDAPDPSGEEGSLAGLVLLDLPDFDSRDLSHRHEAERILELCDVFVWVTDPQKYADALLHDDFVRNLAGHASVMLVVLNQADRLDDAGLVACRADLARLFAADGVHDVSVLTTSVLTGQGIDELRQRLANAVAGHEASRHRLAADLRASAARLRRGVGDTEPTIDTNADDRLVDALCRASGVPVVLDAVGEDYRREALGRAGWVFTRWGRKMRPDPLGRLRLDKRSTVLDSVDPLDVRQVLGRSSIPAPTASARSAVKLAALELAERGSDGLPVLWSEAVSDAATPTDRRLYEDLDRAVVSTSLRGNPPAWWRVMGWVQWVTGLATVAGLVWLTVLGVIGWLQLPQIDTPKLGALPVPFLLFGGGLVLGLLAAWLARSLARVGAGRRRTVVDARLREAVGGVATQRLVVPVVDVLDRHRTTRSSLDEAART